MILPGIRALPIISAGEEPPPVVSYEMSVKRFFKLISIQGLINKPVAEVKGRLAQLACASFKINKESILVVEEGIGQLLVRKDILTPELVYRCGLYVAANKEYLAKNIIVNTIDRTRLTTEVWCVIKVVDMKKLHRTDKGWLYNVQCLILNTPLAGTLFETTINGSFIKFIIRDCCGARYATNIYPEMLFGFKLEVTIRSGKHGLAIQKVNKNEHLKGINARIRRDRNNCPKGILCCDCFKGIDACRFAVKRKSWKKVACPYCLQDTYQRENGTTLCRCHTERLNHDD